MSAVLQTARATVATRGDSYTTVSLESLRLGAVLQAPIFTSGSGDDALLLAAGQQLTESQLQRLRSRGVASVLVHADELSRLVHESGVRGLRQRRSRRVEQAVSPPAAEELWRVTSDSWLHRVAEHGASGYSREKLTRNVQEFQHAVGRVELAFDELLQATMRDVTEITSMTAESLTRLAEDLDMFLLLGLNPATNQYPCRHGLQVAMLAIAMGTIMGLRKEELLELGLGCLIHDAGMLHMRESLWRLNRRLSRLEFLEITRHPTKTYELLRDVPDVPRAAALVAYQIHERCDGSGYPRQLQGRRIHPLARVAAVADSYIAMVSTRPHRGGQLPGDVVVELLKSARNGLLDPLAVRALLYTVSLFPIGSIVELSDGCIARVSRGNRHEYTRPVVELLRTADGRDSQEAINLATRPELSIRRTLRSAAIA